MFASRNRWTTAMVILVLVGLAGMWLAGPVLVAQAPRSADPAKDSTSYRDVVKKVLPAVVSVEVKARSTSSINLAIPRRQSWMDDAGLPPDLRRFFDDFPVPVETLEPVRRGFGSGFVVEPSGVIVTNHHVVKGAQEVTVHLQDGRTVTSRDIKSDPRTDIAVIRIRTDAPLPSVAFGDSAGMEIGDRVLAMGAPFGFAGSVSAGIISGKGRNLNGASHENFLQTDAAINPGNSGGPLINLEGKVIGVNTAIRSNSGGSQGVGLAIPSNTVRAIIDKLLTDGVVRRGYLGVQVARLEQEIGARLGAGDKSGVVVARVLDDSPAARAGIQAGDIITALAAKAVKDPADLQRRVADLPVNKDVAVTILRNGNSQELQVTLDALPDETDAQPNATPTPRPRAQQGVHLNKIGIEIADLNADLARQFGHAEMTAGAIVTRVDAGSLAAQAGLRPGARIVRVNGAEVQTAAQARRALEESALERGILLQLEFPDNGAGYIMLKVGANR